MVLGADFKVGDAIGTGEWTAAGAREGGGGRWGMGGREETMLRE